MLRKLCDMVQKGMYAIGMAAVGLFFVCTVVQVLSRTFGFRAAFTEEIANAALAWCCFIGAAPLVRSNEHFRFTAFCEKMKGKPAFANGLICLVLVLLFNVLIAYHGTLLVKQFSAWKLTSLPKVSKGWIWLCVPLCGYAATLFSIENIVNYIANPSSRLVVNAVDEAMKEAEKC